MSRLPNEILDIIISYIDCDVCKCRFFTALSVCDDHPLWLQFRKLVITPTKKCCVNNPFIYLTKKVGHVITDLTLIKADYSRIRDLPNLRSLWVFSGILVSIKNCPKLEEAWMRPDNCNQVKLDDELACRKTPFIKIISDNPIFRIFNNSYIKIKLQMAITCYANSTAAEEITAVAVISCFNDGCIGAAVVVYKFLGSVESFQFLNTQGTATYFKYKMALALLKRGVDPKLVKNNKSLGRGRGTYDMKFRELKKMCADENIRKKAGDLLAELERD